jgi:hypothetical protein
MNYSIIKKLCEENSRLSASVIDNFMIYYAAEKEKLEPQLEVQLKKYKRVVNEIPVSYIGFLKSE